MRLFFSLLSALVVAAVVWGVALEPYRTDHQRWTVQLPGLPPAWDGQQVAVIADLQVGMWLNNTRHVADIVAHLVERQPALVLIAGDFVYHPLGDPAGPSRRDEFRPQDLARAAEVIERAVALVRPLPAAGIPTFAVLGNHDYGMQNRHARHLDWLAADLVESLQAAGVRVLRNEAAPVAGPAGGAAPDGAPALYVVGIDSHYAGQSDPARSFTGVPAQAPRLVLMHHPSSFPQIAAHAAPLALAAHTHGGQIRLPGTPHWSWMGLVNPGEVHADGWIDGSGAAGNRLYVNRGVGFSVVPVRLNAMPEVTWVELRRGPATAAATSPAR